MADSPQQPAGWDQPCSEAHLAVIADSISDWRAVSPFLGLTEAEESAILGSSPHSVPAQRIAMLRKWRETRSKDHVQEIVSSEAETRSKDHVQEIVSSVYKVRELTS